jgi:nucleoside phosphorylase
MPNAEATILQKLIGNLDEIMHEAETGLDFQQALVKLVRWKDSGKASLAEALSKKAASEFWEAGDFYSVFPGDFETLKAEAERHRRVLSKLVPPIVEKSLADFTVISIREDEADAVLNRLPSKKLVFVKNRSYWMEEIKTKTGHLSIAAVRTTGQGELKGQDSARDAIEDLHPKWLALVGICGAVPDSEFTLGDVIVASRLHAFATGAIKEDSPSPMFSNQGGPMTKMAEDLVANLKGLEETEFADWNKQPNLGAERPTVNLDDNDNFYGSKKAQARTREALAHHFKTAGARNWPIVTTGEIASSDFLIKNTATIQKWQQSARHLAGVEMELAGVYEAARRWDQEYPILSVRGISDVVGFKRDERWTKYACATAAAFFFALLRVLPKHYLVTGR